MMPTKMSEDPLGSSLICKLCRFSCSTSTPSLGVQHSEILSYSSRCRKPDILSTSSLLNPLGWSQIIPRIITNILQLIKYQWSLPEEVLTPDTLCIPNTDPCIKGRLTKMYPYMYSTYHQYPGIYLYSSSYMNRQENICRYLRII